MVKKSELHYKNTFSPAFFFSAALNLKSVNIKRFHDYLGVGRREKNQPQNQNQRYIKKRKLITINLLCVTPTVQLNDELSVTCSEIKVQQQVIKKPVVHNT